MKNSTLVIFLLMAVLKAQAQDCQISFAGTGESTTVDSVQVRNLTQNTGLTLDGTDVLHLMGIVGIDQAVAQSIAGLRIYPNPIKENSFIEFETVCSGNAIIDILDITGKPVAETQIMLPCGMHTFTISGLSSGIYTLSIQSAENVYSGKIVCTGIARGNPKINHVSGIVKSAAKSKLKGVQTLVPMQYNDGDQLLFKCFSGIYATVIPLVPTASQTVTANFVDCTDTDNNNYATVTIGSQTWMAENLNVGVRMNGSQEQENDSVIEKYCFYDSTEYCHIYGGLYQWNEMMQYTTIPGVQGICPTGWHLPTDVEWTDLTTFLGDLSVVGGKMKSTGTIEVGTGLWFSPNAGATNESGFTVVPASARTGAGTFGNVGHFTCLWSSTISITETAWVRYIGFNDSYLSRSTGLNITGYSVRCLRDESIPFTCGSPITINHVAGAVAPVDKTLTYGTVTDIPGESSKCWITSNLGADHQASTKNDATEPSAGWYWQFNRKQGYKHDGTTLTPNTTWISSINENSDWLTANDPCAIELGSGWRIPTKTEWTNVNASGNWTNWNGPWDSDLKLHAAGYLFTSDGSLGSRGSYGTYWSSTQTNATDGWYLYFSSRYSLIYNYSKSYGFSARCVSDN